MKESKNINIIETPDGGIFILQRPAYLAKKKREAVERASAKLDAEVEARRERRRASARSTAAAASH